MSEKDPWHNLIPGSCGSDWRREPSKPDRVRELVIMGSAILLMLLGLVLGLAFFMVFIVKGLFGANPDQPYSPTAFEALFGLVSMLASSGLGLFVGTLTWAKIMSRFFDRSDVQAVRTGPGMELRERMSNWVFDLAYGKNGGHDAGRRPPEFDSRRKGPPYL